MTIKKMDSGIFQREIIIGGGKAEAKLWQRWCDNASLAKQLDLIEGKALRILAKYGIHKWPAGARIPHGLFDTAENEELLNADSILWHLNDLRHHLDNKDCESIARHALALGRLETMLDVRPHEKPAVIGRKVQKGGDEGRKSLSRKYTNASLAHEQWAEYADALQRTYESRFRKPLSSRQTARTVSAHFKVKFETVRKALRKNK